MVNHIQPDVEFIFKMERRKPEQIGDVLRSLFEENSMQNRLDEVRAADMWPNIVGEAIALLCSKPFVNNGLMTIGVKSASLRHELNMNRSSLIKALNLSLGKDIVKEIRFVS